MDLVQQHDGLEGPAVLEPFPELEPTDVHHEQQQLGALHVLQELVAHTHVEVCALDQPRQVSHRDLHMNKIDTSITPTTGRYYQLACTCLWSG